MTGDSDSKSVRDTDATGEFFSVGAPLHAVKAGYIHRRADDLLYEAVTAGRYAHVLAPNRTGKSSLIAAVSARVESANIRVATLDLKQIAPKESDTDVGRWFYNLAYRLLRQLRIRMELQEWWQDKALLTNRQRLLEFYSEIILPRLDGNIVVFVDSLMAIEGPKFAPPLLASIRAAHDARIMDPDFQRLTFVLVGECDPVDLVDDPLQSPFNVSQAINLRDFERDKLDLFATELNLSPDDAQKALDRVYYWTSGHPYLSQKLARAISRATITGDLVESIDKLVVQQMSGRAATRNEPHLSHLHNTLLASPEPDAVLNLYGRIRKGVNVATDLGQSAQRRLLSQGMVVLDEHGSLQPRNRIYEMVFTARWANENLPSHWRVVAYVAAGILLMLAVPFWYTQLLPNPYVRVLTATETTLDSAQETWLNLRSFPGHTESADAVFRQYLLTRAAASDSEPEILRIAAMADAVDGEAKLGSQLTADFWDRRVVTALRDEDRDGALLAAIRSFETSTRARRNRAAMLVSSDYPLLLDTLQADGNVPVRFDSVNQVLSRVDDANVTQWAVESGSIEASPDRELRALDIEPLVRRVAVGSEGAANRIGLTLRISHQRFDDLFIRLTAPSGKSVTINPPVRRASTNDEIRIPGGQLRALVGESLDGTWSLSIRDQAPGVGGHLVGWNLTLNGQGLPENFQRGLNIPNPLEVPASSVWVDPGNRYATARAPSGDSVRVWDLAFGKPLGAVAVSANEQLVGLDLAGQTIVTATPSAVHVWEVATGRLLHTLDIDTGADSLRVLPDEGLLSVRRVNEDQTTFETWSLGTGKRLHRLELDVQPLLDAVSADGRRVAIADADRAVRVWDMPSEDLLAQFNLSFEPGSLDVSYDGSHVGVVYRGAGVAQYQVASPGRPVFEEFGDGDWRFAFSPAGNLSLSGHAGIGYQVRRSVDGAPTGPMLGFGGADSPGVLAFSDDERSVVTPWGSNGARVWTMPLVADETLVEARQRVSPGLDGPMVVLPGGERLLSADASGLLHVIDVVDGRVQLTGSEDISYIGHSDAIRHVAVSDDGRMAASLGDDDEVRFWDLASGLPSSAVLSIPAAQVTAMQFSPAGRQLAVLTAGSLVLVDTASAEIVDTVEFLEPQLSLEFRDDQSLFTGSAGGNLLEVTSVGADSWTSRPLWRGTASIAHLALSRDGQQLVIADGDARLLLFDLATSRLVGDALPLPGPVTSMTFAQAGPDLYAKTQRWVHRLSSTADGLLWRDALLVPRIAGNAPPLAVRGDSFVLPTVYDGEFELTSFRYSGRRDSGLFGNRDELLAEWRARFSLDDAPREPPIQRQGL